ncbi:hypothetical protein GUITHDRAFT_133576 [Guillardia theta CCMP2712]|uniref:Uncharacterized protein n=1 Tax=Guillardia theta (strain CCMP2712) TaxID=905079 RepID=L1JVZ2_GUITC|nr:hypothetical protein GUITHDRAFT_133576 [Guillardia theta CCMP2712]EKX52494.1 hypothetical protein GUITHDRAFT_133576 [Guillardia theta CCMP2712]|eukprot:XP_005839474.1 hypothetical protein GUITHDRAFT_133576 [Guillardia theta CCMP2712]
MLSLLYRALDDTKTRCASIHPSMPWVAAGDDRGYVGAVLRVSIHDYSQNMQMYKARSFASLLTLMSLPQAQVEQGLEGRAIGAKCSPVRHLIFCDAHANEWKERAILDESLPLEDAATFKGDASGPSGMMDGEARLLIVTDSALLFLDYITLQVKEVRGIDPRSILQLHLVPGRRIPRVACACSDGIVRILSCSMQAGAAKELQSGRSRALAHLSSCASCKPKEGREHVMKVGLVAASSDGYIHLWDLNNSQNVSTVQAAGHIQSLAPSSPACQSFVVMYVDKTMGMWEVSPQLREVQRLKLHEAKTRQGNASLDHVVGLRQRHPHGLVWLLLGSKHANIELLSSHCSASGFMVEATRDYTSLLHLPDVMGRGDKKMPSKFKMYAAVSSELQGDVLGLATSHGLLVFRLEMGGGNHVQEVQPESVEASKSFVMLERNANDKHVEFSLLHGSVSVPNHPLPPCTGHLPMLRVEWRHALPGEAFAADDQDVSSRLPVLKTAGEGRGSILSILSHKPPSPQDPSTRRVQFVRRKEGKFHVVEAMSCQDAAWDSEGEKCAVLLPHSPSNIPRGDGEHNFSTAAVVLDWSGDHARARRAEIILQANVEKLLDGALLCGIFAKKEGQGSGCMFYQWDGSPASAVLPAPDMVKWSRTRTMCAAAYKSFISIFQRRQEDVYMQSILFFASRHSLHMWSAVFPNDQPVEIGRAF